MKKLVILILAFTFSTQLFAQNVIKAIANNGKWNHNNSWDLNRQPKNGDTVVIPSNVNLIVNSNINLSSSNLYIDIAGVLDIRVGKLDLGSGSTVLVETSGKIISTYGNQTSSEFIKIGGVNKFLGTDLEISGPASANGSTGASPNGFDQMGNIALPVKFIGFSLAKRGNDVLVQWATSEETNAKHFEIERTEGSNWQTVATITAAGNSTAVNNYSYTDRSINAKTIHYRIRQVDMDGRSVYTPVKSIKTDGKDMAVQIAAINKKLVLQFPEQLSTNVELKLVNMSGQVIGSQTLNRPFGQVVINNSQVRGNMIVSLSNAEGMRIAKQVIF